MQALARQVMALLELRRFRHGWRMRSIKSNVAGIAAHLRLVQTNP